MWSPKYIPDGPPCWARDPEHIRVTKVFEGLGEAGITNAYYILVWHGGHASIALYRETESDSMSLPAATARAPERY